MSIEMYPETGVIYFRQFGDICVLLTFLWSLKLSLQFAVLISELWSMSLIWKNIWRGRAIRFVISWCCYLWKWLMPSYMCHKPSDVSKWSIISLCSDRMCLQVQKRMNFILCEAYLCTGIEHGDVHFNI